MIDLRKSFQVRGFDGHGFGHFKAPRGLGLKHNGTDVLCVCSEDVVTSSAGTVTKIGYPYSPADPRRGHYRYVEVTTDNGDRERYMYVLPVVEVDDVISKGVVIGSAQGLCDTYCGITDHIHFEVIRDGKYIDPIKYLEKTRWKP